MIQKQPKIKVFVFCCVDVVFERLEQLTVSRLLASTSIIPRRRFWQSGGIKCGMWKTPSFTFSNKFRKLSSSNGSAPCRKTQKR